jgi:putative SOS response-associated peptidase YedK
MMEDNPLSAGTRAHWRNVLIEAATDRKFVMVTTNPCPVCHKRSEFVLDSLDVQRWIDGELIQEAMPYLTPVEREALVSGVCSDKCWNELWADSDD